MSELIEQVARKYENIEYSDGTYNLRAALGELSAKLEGAPAQATREQLASRVAALEQQIADAIAILDQAGDNRDEALAKLQEV